jgi:hypothetical protein
MGEWERVPPWISQRARAIHKRETTERARNENDATNLVIAPSMGAEGLPQPRSHSSRDHLASSCPAHSPIALAKRAGPTCWATSLAAAP